MGGYMMRFLLRLLFSVSVCVLIFATSLFSQTDRGTITGTVADASSAVIQGANVTATNSQTTAKYETVSTETGNYTLTQLPAGTYELTVELPGFTKTLNLPADSNGHVDTKVAAGFGFINTSSAPSTPASRQGQIVAGITF